MRSRSARLLLFIASALVLSCAAGLIASALSLLPFEYQQARQRWEQRRPQHYEVDVAWADGWSSGYARVEVRDNRFIAGTDLNTGRALDPSRLADASYFASIDNLFKILDARMQPQWYWRVQLARHYPLLAHWLDSCVPPLTDVSYDPAFGYPADISYNNGWCSNTFFTYSNVRVKRFRPLP